MRILKIAADFMDSAMNNERLNMGEVVGEMMEPFPIQISHWLVKPFNLTYWGCLYLKNKETTAYFVIALKLGNFQNSKQFSKGGPLEKSYLFNFSKSFYFTLEYHMGLLYNI